MDYGRFGKSTGPFHAGGGGPWSFPVPSEDGPKTHGMRLKLVIFFALAALAALYILCQLLPHWDGLIIYSHQPASSSAFAPASRPHCVASASSTASGSVRIATQSSHVQT